MVLLDSNLLSVASLAKASHAICCFLLPSLRPCVHLPGFPKPAPILGPPVERSEFRVPTFFCGLFEGNRISPKKETAPSWGTWCSKHGPQLASASSPKTPCRDPAGCALRQTSTHFRTPTGRAPVPWKKREHLSSDL